ncbi:superoxide dismutase [Venturia nashicola]|uniref:Superoxide dismutase n=1 Tax=Venturia nashicola TaxID=86259 RepID=A0A4Z1PKN6_9PEZI|nr:superoxide dismutase [Venturia nashicola]
MSTSTNDSHASNSSAEAEIEPSVETSFSGDRERFVVARLPPSLFPHTRAYLWGSALHDNIIMSSKESGIAQAVRMGSFVFLTNTRSTITVCDLYPIFLDLPNSVLMHNREHAPGFYATSFKVDMPTEYKAKKLVLRLLQERYAEQAIDFAEDSTVFAGDDTEAKDKCSPLGFGLARMKWEGGLLAKMAKGTGYLGWQEMDRIITQALDIAVDPFDYMDHLLNRVINTPDSLEEWHNLSEVLQNVELVLESKWALVLVWEIRLGVQMDLAEDPDFALNWQDGDKTGIEYAFVRRCYNLRETAPGYSEFVRNGEEHELEPWLRQEVIEEYSISSLEI